MNILMNNVYKQYKLLQNYSSPWWQIEDKSSHSPLDQGSLGQWKADQGQVANT